MVYTPQFLLSGDDHRSYASFRKDVNKLASQKASVDLLLSARVFSGSHDEQKLQLNLTTDISASKFKDVGFYLVVMEHNLMSDISDGENDGKRLHHPRKIS